MRYADKTQIDKARHNSQQEFVGAGHAPPAVNDRFENDQVTPTLKRILALIGALLILAALAWSFRLELALFVVSRVAAPDEAILPTQEVHWQQGPAQAPAPADETPPNILLILADDLGWNDITLHGGLAEGRVPTRNIDSIADQGVHFTQGYAANATCAPSRAALMSGRYATRFGFEFTPTPGAMMPMMRFLSSVSDREAPPTVINRQAITVPFDDKGMPSSEVTLAELLRDQGYRTLHIGKWHLGRAPGMRALDQGFDESLLMASGLYGRLDDPGVIQSRQMFDPIDLFLWRAMSFAARFNDGPDFEPPTYLTDYYTDEAVKAIKANRHRPFFLYLAHWAPHTPLQATKEDFDAFPDIELHRERVYGGMIRALDRSVGRVLETLRELGLEDNTLVIFTSDNGGAGYIGLPDVNHPYRGWKISLFEGGLRVPFLAKWPGRIPAGISFDAPVHHFDLYATAAAAAGAEVPQDRKLDGVDLMPFVRGELDADPHEALFWRSGAAGSVRMGRYKLVVSAPEGHAPEEWLFDLDADPGEQRDLASEMPEKLDELRTALQVWSEEQSEPLWDSQSASPVNVDRDLSQPDQPGDIFAYWSN